MLVADLLADVLDLLSYTVLLPVLLAVLFLVSWQAWRPGSRFGFDRTAFWLLVVGGGVGSLANLPIFFFGGSVLAVNLGGALFPVLLSLWLLRRIFQGSARLVAEVLAPLAGASTLLLVFVVGTNDQVPFGVLAGVLALFGGLLGALRRALVPSGAVTPAERSVLPTYALLSSVLGVTYVTTFALPGTGIVSYFPFYLAAPTVAALGSVVLRRRTGDAPALAYATGTLGVLVGADVLHEPPLYTVPFLGAIGGAGLQDLVYLSGLVALALALLLFRPSPTPVEAPASTKLLEAWERFRQGRYREVYAPVLAGVEEEARRLRRDLGLPGGDPGRTIFVGLPLSPLVSGDYENLRHLSARSPPNPDEAWRAILAGYHFRRLFQEIWARRLSGSLRRTAAFGLDLALTMAVPLALLGAWVLSLSPAQANALADSIPFNTYVLLIGTVPFLIFAGTEAAWGRTPGKALLGLRVVQGGLGTPELFPALLRNVPKLLPLNAIAVGLAAAFLVEATGLGALLTGTVVLATIGVALITCSVGFFLASRGPRHQRIGDLMAGTWVTRLGGPPAQVRGAS